MKKLLSLIGALTLVGTASAPAIACNNTSNPAKDLINKVKGAKITVPVGTPTTISDQLTQAAIRISLGKAKSLTLQEASELSFSGKDPLVAGKQVQVTVIANVSGQTAKGRIDVTLKAKTPAQKLIDKVNGANITVPSTTPTAISDPKTQTAIRNALVEKVKSLTSKEANELSFSGSKPLATKQPIPVTVTATVSGQTAKGRIEVTLDNPAQDLINKIKNKNVILPSAIPWTDKTKYPDTSNATIKIYIMQMLKINNTDLSDNDLTKLSLSKTTLLPSTDVTVGLTAKVDGDSATMDIKVKWNISKAEIIIARITKVNLTVPTGTNPIVTNQATITAIKTALKKANPNLLQSDLSALSFTATKPLSTTAIPVTAVAYVEGGTASITLQVKIAS